MPAVLSKLLKHGLIRGKILAAVAPRKLKGNFLSNQENRNHDFMTSCLTRAEVKTLSFASVMMLGHSVNSLGLTPIGTCRGPLLPITYRRMSAAVGRNRRKLYDEKEHSRQAPFGRSCYNGEPLGTS